VCKDISRYLGQGDEASKKKKNIEIDSKKDEIRDFLNNIAVL
jgi:hypothetical protein